MFYNAEYDLYVREGNSFTIGDTTYHSQWLFQSTPEQKAALGFVEVVVTNERKDDRFYWVSEELNGATLTYVNTPKDLDDLKKSWEASTNAQAYSQLVQSDWMVVKAVETQSTVPADWSAYRESVRTTAGVAKAAIDACTSVDDLASAVSNVQWPRDPSYVAREMGND